MNADFEDFVGGVTEGDAQIVARDGWAATLFEAAPGDRLRITGYSRRGPHEWSAVHGMELSVKGSCDLARGLATLAATGTKRR